MAARAFAAAMLLVVGLTLLELRPGGRLTGTELAHAARAVGLLGDRIDVVAAEGLDAADVRIDWRCAGPDGPLEVTDVVAHGLPECGGWNRFTVQHRGARIAEPVHFKTNDWHVHVYRFFVEQHGGPVVARLEIDGPDAPVEH